MKAIILLLLLSLLPLSWVTPAPRARKSGICHLKTFKKQRNLQHAYKMLRFGSCRNTSNDYYQFGRRALVAHRPAEALWAADAGLKEKGGSSLLRTRLRLLRGHALATLGRNEESITALRDLAFAQNSRKRPLLELQQRAHLLLIKAYFQKSKKKSDPNVSYLVTLFRRYHPRSPYLNLLRQWERS